MYIGTELTFFEKNMKRNDGMLLYPFVNIIRWVN